jgi:hypothetical protein
VGQTASVNIDLKPVTRNNSGDVRSVLEVVSNTQSLNIGMIVDGSGPQLYIEYTGSFEDKWAANYNTNYTVHIERTGTDEYKAWNGTHSETHSVSQAGRGVDMGTHIGNADGSSCNTFTSEFTSTSPWGPSGMDHVPALGYYADKTGSNSFETGVDGTSYFACVVGPMTGTDLTGTIPIPSTPGGDYQYVVTFTNENIPLFLDGTMTVGFTPSDPDTTSKEFGLYPTESFTMYGPTWVSGTTSTGHYYFHLDTNADAIQLAYKICD